MQAFSMTTCMAQNMDDLCRDLAGYLASRLSVPVKLIIDIPWQERERLFDSGEIDLSWICGLPYVVKADQNPGRIEPFAAPVMAGSRYLERPIYFSDVVVHRDSPYQRLDDLRGAAWAYNEPGSHSGYGVVRYALARRGETLAFFGRLIESGAHQASLEMILNGEAAATAIDSTVLELEIANHPEIAGQIRIIDTFGPSPIPPWVVSLKIPLEMRQLLQDQFIQMHKNPQGLSILRKFRMARFEAVSAMDYQPIREMASIASGMK